MTIWCEQQSNRYSMNITNGTAYAMTGSTLPHNDIALNLNTHLRSLLRSRWNTPVYGARIHG